MSTIKHKLQVILAMIAIFILAIANLVPVQAANSATPPQHTRTYLSPKCLLTLNFLSANVLGALCLTQQK